MEHSPLSAQPEHHFGTIEAGGVSSMWIQRNRMVSGLLAGTDIPFEAFDRLALLVRQDSLANMSKLVEKFWSELEVVDGALVSASPVDGRVALHLRGNAQGVYVSTREQFTKTKTHEVFKVGERGLLVVGFGDEIEVPVITSSREKGMWMKRK